MKNEKLHLSQIKINSFVTNKLEDDLMTIIGKGVPQNQDIFVGKDYVVNESYIRGYRVQ